MPPWFKRSLPWLAAALSGLLCALAFPRWNLPALAWLWQWPLLAVLWLGPALSRRKAFALGCASVGSFFLVSLSWLWELGRTVENVWAGLAAWTLLPLYLSLYGGAWAMVAATAGRWRPPLPPASAGPAEGWLSRALSANLPGLKAAFINAAAWVALEWLRGIVFTGFGWNGLGVSQYRTTVLIQIADITGVAGLSFLLIFVGQVGFITVARFIREMRDRRLRRPHLDFAAAMSLLVFTFLYGVTRLMEPRGETVPLRTMVVQLAIPIDHPYTRESLERVYEDYHDLTATFATLGEGVDLVVWPESAVPGDFHSPGIQRKLDLTLAQGNFHLLTGADVHVIGTGADYNCMVLMKDRAAEGQIHEKRHLVPFGEYIPLRGSFPLFAWATGSMIPSDFAAGTSTTPLQMTDPRIGIIPLICFEDTMGRLARDFVRPGPQLMVNATNGAWFWDSANMEQHLANAVFRTVELRRPMVRAGNTGVSCFIDERGHLLSEGGVDRIRDPDGTSTFVRGTLTQTVAVPLNGRLTFYARHGERFAQACALAALLALALHGWESRRKRTPEAGNKS